MTDSARHSRPKMGPYTILEKLGQGSMGIVYRANDDMLDRHVALKTMAGDMVSSAELRKRFVQEARLAAKLIHPNIITIYDLGEARGQIYIAMELLEGRDLKAYIRTGLREPLRKLVDWAIQLADAVSFAHRQGIIHRDIKPGNIHIREDGTLVLMDFGIARTNANRISGDGAIIGTPEYISPEQVLALHVDHRADIFSLGLVYYEMFTFSHPFRGTTLASTIHNILNEKPSPPHQIDSRIPKPISHIILRCMEKDVNRRYQNCSELLVALRNLAVV